MSCHQLVLQTAVNIPAFVRIVASDLQVESFDFAIFELDFIRHKSTAKFPAAPGPGRKRFAQFDYLQAAQVILRFVVKRITGSRFPELSHFRPILPATGFKKRSWRLVLACCPHSLHTAPPRRWSALSSGEQQLMR